MSGGAGGEAGRWELTAEERERVAGSAAPFGAWDLLRALLARPRLLAQALRSALRGAAQGVRSDPDLAWFMAGRRVRRLAPGAATGASWHGEEDFMTALGPMLDPAGSALEVGCGAGRISRLVAPRVRELICSDISQAMLDEAQLNLTEQRNVRYLRTSGLTLAEIETGSVDAAFAHDVLVAFDADPALALLDSINRVLRPGGALVVSFVTIDRPEWARVQLELVRAQAATGRFGPSHPRAYAEAQISALTALAGFEAIEARYGDDAGGRVRPHFLVTARAAAG